MEQKIIIILGLLALAYSAQASSIFGNNTDLRCKNDTQSFICNSTDDVNRYPEVCCNFGVNFICCNEIPTFIGAIVGGIMACCVVCVGCPLLILLFCCCCLGAACCGRTGSNMKVVKSGYKRV
ncbi:hypothetical protein LOD99_12903 [Oopsacas minuta]|uniref:Uncharacterized protein n=1 Tax=Oopsacas minuta TaxID=111878 RepID=A0AAV7JA62_9METZ|nr:hypothetical protein LOD99_12903 [Oopsacas minuta]